eukprot:665270-Pyramimonas_sp.AAC.1
MSYTRAVKYSRVVHDLVATCSSYPGYTKVGVCTPRAAHLVFGRPVATVRTVRARLVGCGAMATLRGIVKLPSVLYRCGRRGMLMRTELVIGSSGSLRAALHGSSN